jgi:hypothetical protein
VHENQQSCKLQMNSRSFSLEHHRNWLVGTQRQLLVTANVVPSSPILVTLMMEAQSSSEKSVLTRVTRCNIPETGFFLVIAVKNSNLIVNYLSARTSVLVYALKGHVSYLWHY